MIGNLYFDKLPDSNLVRTFLGQKRVKLLQGCSYRLEVDCTSVSNKSVCRLGA